MPQKSISAVLVLLSAAPTAVVEAKNMVAFVAGAVIVA